MARGMPAGQVPGEGMPDVGQAMLLVRAVNRFLGSSYTISQLMEEWDPLWYEVFDALVSGMRAEELI